MTRAEYEQRRFEFCKRGADLPQSKLDVESVNLIRELHAYKTAEINKLNETLSADGLAKKFGVHVRTIEKVLRYETWKHA